MNEEKPVFPVDTILLGVFGTPTYEIYEKLPNVRSWALFSGDVQSDFYLPVIEVVRLACFSASKIIFILDDVHFPLNTGRSVTCRELELICMNDVFFNKTIFVKGHQIINLDKNLVK